MIAAFEHMVKWLGYALWIEAVTAFSPQTMGLEPQFLMPAILEENSGLVWDDEHQTFWTHNDSGGKPRLFEVDTTGKIVKEVYLKGASNRDWEELALDRETKTLFVGDFGNNRNKRKDLTVYRLPLPRGKAEEVACETISFRYPNQSEFPPVDNKLEFDMEAMIYWNDSLYLFSKNRTEPYSGYTFMYRVPSAPGEYVAELVDSFATGGSYYMTQWITAADLSPSGDRLVLLNNGHLWSFSNYTPPYFLRGDATKHTFERATQKEAITFKNDWTLFISEEKSSGPGALYLGTLPDGH